MKRLFLVAAITSLLLTMASISWAASNLNFSKSNINRMVSDPAVVSPTQAAAILTKLDELGPGVNVVKLKEILSKVGVKLGHLQVIEIMPPAKKGEPPLILLLANPMDKAQATRIAINDPGMPPERPIKSK
jgi:hypothetical protein